ncbi:penicillin-binding transpeptidase domain-containing protein [Halobacillus dabanensis]|nr:penicillin-binding transpeptidase domain-containing protein [Halobacillus dabanensis]
MLRWILFSFILVMLAACSDQPKPEETFKAYMDDWEQQNFSDMYAHLSESSKNVISEEEFVERYTNIYEDMGTEELEFTYNLPEEEQEYEAEDTPSFEYDASLESLAGTIEFSHAARLVFEEGEEENRWAIDWNSSMIFPEMEEGDTVEVTALFPERGEIFGADGQGLAINGTVNEVGIVPGEMEDEEKLKEGFSEILNMSIEEIDQKLNQSWVGPETFVPLAKVPDDEEERLKAINNLPGGKLIDPGVESRVYPLGEAAAHLTGYMGNITAEELEEHEGYSATDKIGKSGLEKVMEKELRGETGWNISVYNEEGERKEVLAEKAEEDGQDVNLTIAVDVQKAIYEQMKDDSGAAAAIHPTTGEVLALVSTPAYDPNAKTLGLGEETTLNKFNRTFSPGSTFKPITAAIGLESGVIDPAEDMTISGETENVGGHEVTRVEGASSETQVNLRDALVRSDNIYFAREILEIGGDEFLQATKDFGFGEELPVEFPIESSQILNDSSFDSDALLADTGYGQGQVQMSPLHLAMTYTPFVTGGSLIKPSMVAEKEEGQVWHENVMSEETASIIQESLKAVVDNPAGTAHHPDIEGLDLAGKTGTAELKQSQGEEGQENGWFVAWDTETQDLLVSMMIEDAKEGSHTVVPKVKNVFQTIK